MQATSIDAPIRLPLVTVVANRDATMDKDSKLVNCYPEKDGEAYMIYGRPGLALRSVYSGEGRGVYNWNGVIYSVYGGSLLKDGVVLGAVDATNGMYRFQEIRGVTPYLVFGNATKTYYTDGTTITDMTGLVNFPTNLVKGFAYLDGTLYVMDEEAQIWGSADLDDPTVWDPLNKIIARVDTDKGVYLAKQQSYVVAVKQYTVEAFYDAANEAGSPLGTVQGAKLDYGCVSADSVQEFEGILIWVTQSRNGASQVALMINLQAQIVSSPAIERQLSGWDYTTIRSWVFKRGGHRFYGITSVVSNSTLVYDLDAQVWCPWTDTNGNYWPIVGTVSDSAREIIAQGYTNGKMYYARPNYLQTTDDGEQFSIEIISPNWDGGLDKRKTLQILRINADQATVSDLLYVRWSEDDYQTWSIWRSFDLSKKRPFLANLGTFTRRAFHFQRRSAQPFRLSSADMTADLGTF